jgi:hypothetical protein
MAKIRVSVSVSDAHLGDLSRITKAAKKAGMKVEQTLGALGLFTGSIDPRKRKQLQAIEGVASVEEERSFGIAPPDSRVQ